MFKNQHRKLLFFGFLIFLGLLGALFFSNFILAQGSDWYRVTKNGGSEEIDKHGICWIVINNRTDYDIFVPVKTLAEWQAFINSIQNESYPQNVVLSPCVEICYLAGVPQTTNWGANLYGCVGFNRRCYQGDCKTCEDDITPDRHITKALIYSDGYGCDGCAGQGGNACWRVAQQGDGINYGPTDYSCDILCANYGGCVAANWNESLDCGMIDALTENLTWCIDTCESFKDWGTLPPDTDCQAYCCKEGNWDNWGTNAPKLPAYGFSFPPPNGVYYRASFINQDCDGLFVSNKRFCVCQY